MGRYNPHVPQILGQEWVPIREEPLTLTPAVNLIEVGHGFDLTSSAQIQTARFYLNDWPPGSPAGQVHLAAVYRQNTETLTGPIRSVVVPCSASTTFSGGFLLVGASTVQEALLSPADAKYLEFNPSTVTIIRLRFETESYLPILNGKRILGVDFLYTFQVDYGSDPPVQSVATIGSVGSTSLTLGTLVPTADEFTAFNLEIGRIKVGEVDYYWNAPVSSIVEVLPWSPNRIRAFDDSSGLTDRHIGINIDNPTVNQILILEYAALEIFFCEEQRVLWGGRRYTSSNTYTFGANQITMRDLSDTAMPTLTSGSYDLVVSSANLTPGNTVPYPELNQIRQLYEIPPHPAVRVIRPFPIDPTALGQTFENEQTTLLPQLSLHTSGGPVTDVHVYGKQAVAQVYGTITATQEIFDGPAGGSRSYPWVRYYARRFGETQVPLRLSSPSLTGSGQYVEITPSEFDELDEITDGWKEITLRFDTPPAMGSGTNPQWRWSATGEGAGSRWEVLGAFAPALSGIAGNLTNQVASPHQLSLATYGAPVSGSNINLGWVPGYSPPVSATTDDPTADAVLMFALDMPTLTGFSSAIADQEVTGIGLDCGVDPCCIPTEIQYVQLDWGPPQAVILNDTFTRAETDTWGTADTGQVYQSDGGAASNYSVLNGYGQHLLLSNSGRSSYILPSWTDVDMTVEIQCDQLVTGNVIVGSLTGRLVGPDDTYLVELVFNTDQSLDLRIRSRAGGTSTTLVTYDAPFTHDITAWYSVRFQIVGQTLRARVWLTGEEEPDVWHATTTSTTYTVGGVGVRSAFTTGNTNVNPTIHYNNFTATPYYLIGSRAELQRMDTVETEWKTIMLSTDLAITGFKDYEARVGIQSTYRIRLLDPYDFPGEWSSEVTATIPAPGVTIGCDDGHLLIFTSNEQQDGSINLAYSSVWEQGRTVEEGFSFPESQFVQLQAMYNRDFFTAFRPTERGGEQFSRTVLVQAAAISPETLADFTSLRDMAWADVPYICVRDEDGNRWFATVLVPSGRVLRDRRLYLAPVDVIEVTDTPSQVDP